MEEDDDAPTDAPIEVDRHTDEEKATKVSTVAVRMSTKRMGTLAYSSFHANDNAYRTMRTT